MTRKRSHKLVAMGDVDAVIAAAPSLSAAATQLGVNRSTLHRWIEAGKVVKPGPKRGSPESPETPRAGQSPREWADAIRAEHELSRTDLQLLDLAEIALTQARDMTASPRDRLAAIGRFQLVVRQLNLPAPEAPQVAQPSRPASMLSRPARMAGDPRAILQAVK